MSIKCALCDQKEFSVILETHHPIKKQPVIICYECLSDAAGLASEFNGEGFENRVIQRYKRSRKALQPNRCE